MPEKLSYKTLESIDYTGYLKKSAPVKAPFVDYFFDCANERADWNGKIALVTPTAHGRAGVFNEQDCLYTLYLRGNENGQAVSRKRIISVADACYNPYVPEDWKKIKEIAVSDDLEYMISNTTEAGITYDPSCLPDDEPPASFPAKVAVLLHERFLAHKPGIVFLSCELIDDNGKELRNDVLQHARDWSFGEEFADYIQHDCLFCSTLVDRIVPGRVRDPEEVKRLTAENGYEDSLLDVGEVFGVWYIEGPKELEEKLPFRKAGLNVTVVPDVAPYKKRKVRILNGAHTGFVLGAYLAGFDIVRDCMHDEAIHTFMNRMLYDEVIPILPLDRDDCEKFAASVTDRFSNPFIDHQLLSISLNSTAKWKARNLPSLLEYTAKFGRLPKALCMGFAFYIAFYSTGLLRREEGGLVAYRAGQGNEYVIHDDDWVLDFYWDHRDSDDQNLVRDVLSNEKMWDQDLTKADGLMETVLEDLGIIRRDGAEAAFRECFS